MKKIIYWISMAAIVLIAIPVTLIFVYVIRPVMRVERAIEAAHAAMLLPENYRPAERTLARLCQSDPKLFDSDSDWYPPDWTPPEIGKLQLHYIYVKPDEAHIVTGGGFSEGSFFQVDRDVQHSDSTQNTWILSVDQKIIDTFNLPVTDHIGEEELVRNALAELDRKKKAIDSGEDINVYHQDPVADRARLLAQHPLIAQKLGLVIVPTTTATSPFSTQP